MTIGHVKTNDGTIVETSGTSGGEVKIDSEALETDADATRVAVESIDDKTPDLVTPGDADANVPAIPIAARLQWYTGGTWQNIQPYGALPEGNSLGFGVRIISIPTVVTEPAPSFAASTPHAGTSTPEGQTFYLAGYDRVEQIPIETSIWTLPVTIYQGGGLEAIVSSTSDKVVHVRGSDGTDTPERLSTQLTSEEIRDRLPILTMAGAGRVAPFRSLSHVQHDPGNLVSLGGTVAFNPRCDFAIAGGGSLEYVPTKRAVRLAVSGSSGAVATYRQRMWNPAIPGAVQVVVFAVPFDAPHTNQETRVGAFDDSDGVYVLQTSSGVSLGIRSSVTGSPVETTTAIAGLNPALDNIVELRYLWPAGGVEVWSNGARLLAVSKAAGAEAPWMRRPNLPFTAEIRNVGASSAGFVDVIHFDVHSEGADRINRSPATLLSTTTSIPTGGKLMAQIRARQTFDVGTFTNIPNRNVYLPRHIRVDTTNGPMIVRCYANGTTNGAEVWVASTVEMGIEVDQTATFVGASGVLFAAGTIDATTGSCDIEFTDSSIEAFAATSGAYFGSEVLQIVGFARTGTVSTASARVELERIW
jgi:hypothetical protein